MMAEDPHLNPGVLFQKNVSWNESLLLFVGEGNFSFTASLVTSPDFTRLGCRVIATDYIPELEKDLRNITITPENEALVQKTTKATSGQISTLRRNILTLQSQEHKVLFDVDATKLHEHNEILKHIKNYKSIYIIFNFPHAKSKKMKIDLNRDLLRDFFISCDKLMQYLEKEGKCLGTHEIVPIVSLCAGQSGIQEVDSKTRGWGDSWQINDMAAHGNFTCSKVSKFTDWDIFLMAKCLGESRTTTYESSYYRLQGSVSFTTEDALTFSYQHRHMIDPNETSRLKKSILRLSVDHPVSAEVIDDFLRAFSPIEEETVIPSSQNYMSYKRGSPICRPYFHTALCPLVEASQICAYLKISKESFVQHNDQLKVKAEATNKSVVVGESSEGKKILYADQLLELKYGCDYRLLMSATYGKTVTRSLYPRSHEFHISFWINEQFTMNSFIKLLLDVYGLMLKSLEFVEEYENASGRKSTCWCIKVESLELAMSRKTAHQMHLQLRRELSQRLDLEVR